MRSNKRRLCPCVLLFALLIAFTATHVFAQTPEISAKPTGMISGRVTAGQKPLSGVLVVVTNQNSPTPIGQATTDADGNYRVTGLSSGQINVAPVAPVYVVPSSSFSSQQGRPVNLSSNEVVEGIDFKLTRGGVITGRLTDSEGKPVIEERITLTLVDDNGAPTRGAQFVRSSNYMMYQTDDRGVYRLYGLPAGHYKVNAGYDTTGYPGMRPGGYYPRTFYPEESDISRAAIVDVTEGGETKNIDIKLGRRTQTYTVSGRLIDADTNQPVAGAQFSIGSVQKSGNQTYVGGTTGPGTPTNSQGEFRIEGMSPGRYVFMVNPKPYNFSGTSSPKVYNDPVPFEVLDADLTDLEIKARRGLSISGVVVPDGITDRAILNRLSRLVIFANVEPARDAIRTLNWNSTSQINPDWGFQVDGLHPGKARLSVGSFNGPPSTGFTVSRIELNGVADDRMIDLAPGQNISGVKVFVAYGTGVVRGQIKVEGGTITNDSFIFVSLSRQGETDRSMDRYGTQVDSRGNFTIRGIRAGTYEVTLQINSMGLQPLPRGFSRTQRQTVTVTDGAVSEVIFNLDLTRKEEP
jgi:hypothetical protein